MANIQFGDLLNEAETGKVGGGIPAGTYDTEVVDARGGEKQIWLTLQVKNGPAAGKETDVSLYFPDESAKRGARVFFTRKIAGLIGYPDVKAAFQSAENAPTPEAGLTVIANALLGKTVTADIGLRTDGDYAGSNELKSTKAPEGGPSAKQEFAPAAHSAGNNNSNTEVPF